MTRKGQSEDRWLFLTLTRPGYTNRRPEETLEAEISDEKPKKSCYSGKK